MRQGDSPGTACDHAANLAGFISGARFDQLPERTVLQTKRALLDALGCAVAGHQMESGRIVVEIARRLGGRPESTIVGTADRVDVVNAAFVNSQLVNAQDFDPGSVAGHETPAIIGAVLATAESVGATGADVILATALGHEVVRNLLRARGRAPLIITDLGDRVTIPSPPWRRNLVFTLAAAAAASRLLDLDATQTGHALGVASFLQPADTTDRYFEMSPVRMVKYTMFGQVAASGVMGALLAQAGFTGDAAILDPTSRVWEGGAQSPVPHLVCEGLGSWDIAYDHKVFPTNLVSAPAKDCFVDLINQHSIHPHEIERVVIRIADIWRHPSMYRNALATEEEYIYSIPYQIACAAHRIPATEWLREDTRRRSDLRAFVDRVEFDIGCSLRELAISRLRDGSTTMSAEITARGQVFRKATAVRRGADSPDSCRLTTEELTDKFLRTTSPLITSDRAQQAARAILGLDTTTDLAGTLRLLSIEEAS